MREDFAKLLCERPRRGGGWERKGRPLRSGQPMPAFQGLNRGVDERGGGKWLNENLSPLKRYLARQVGRPWNKVHGEMRVHIKPGNTVQEHILTHVEDFISLRVDKVAPTPAAPCGLRRQNRRGWFDGGALREHDLYVDPDDGLIKRARRKLKGPRP